jgi:hypothetical protein
MQAKPLFRADILKPKLDAFNPAEFERKRRTLLKWRNLIASDKFDRVKETEILPDFISEVLQG